MGREYLEVVRNVYESVKPAEHAEEVLMDFGGIQ